MFVSTVPRIVAGVRQELNLKKKKKCVFQRKKINLEEVRLHKVFNTRGQELGFILQTVKCAGWFGGTRVTMLCQ